ncbi:endonuclease/exonuclease/phosphatase family protein [Saccharopolyspora rosea]|uniref:Endonuclease/exonuclease/phosphatase family protein n=1 Tax=Saccharopolyspora rosea TaxID=524884 RepID=A0ABW3G184_9PSEU
MRAFRAVLAVLLAAVAGGVVPAEADAGVPLRVATYNIHAGAGLDDRFDLDRTAGAIRSLDADVVGLQEVDVHWGERSRFTDEARELAARLGVRVFFAPIYDQPGAGPGAPRRRFGVALLSRHPIVDAANHEISRLPTQGPDARPVRMPGFGEVAVQVRGARVHVFCTHLDFRPDPAVRAAQVRDMLAITGRARGPVVLLGDFNAEPGARELAPLWESLRDVDPGGGTYPADRPTGRIDLVAVSPGLRALDAHVVPTTASDHRPVVADLLVTPAGRPTPRR